MILHFDVEFSLTLQLQNSKHMETKQTQPFRTYQYRTQGTCSTMIEIETDGQTLGHVRFTGGCNGNLQGIGALVQGMSIDDVIHRLDNIRCGNKPTSCPHQLALALKAIKGAEVS